jgi:hypothetical protein
MGKQDLAEKTGIGFMSFGLTIGLVSLVGMAAVTAAPSGAGLRAFDLAPGLTAFRSANELREYLRKLRAKQGRAFAPPGIVAMEAAPAMADAAPEESGGDIVVSGARVQGITNNQEANVDEGGIVKVHGEHMVILRRGRLFTVSTAAGDLRPVDSIDAFPPGVETGGDWYDEMLVSGDRVVVIGYSYGRGGTEVNRFRISQDGRLRFEDAYHLRSNDYYSSRNYASRLIGDKLVYYTPLYLGYDGDPLDALPAFRRWRGDAAEEKFKPIVGAREVYMPPRLKGDSEFEIDTLHSVISCDLTAPSMDCSARAVLGPASRTFYVSGEAVYLWMAEGWSRGPSGPSAFVYRLPFGHERPSAIGARGAPVDQFSFREDPDDGVLNVLVRAEGGGDAMWRPEVTDGSVALLRLPIGQFGNGSREAPLSAYRPLPSPRGESWNFRNRFVGSHILYGGGWIDDGPRRDGGMVYAAPVRGGPAIELPLGHGVDRIEALGRDALVVGGGDRDGLSFTAVELAGRSARLGSRYVHPAAAEGETRSHAFFFRPDPRTPGGESGLLGLPVTKAVAPAYHRFFGSAAGMLFLKRQDRLFAPAGELDARVEGVADDGCRASCMDWYGNARPIFLGDRLFALLGYELVEGGLNDGRMRELRRVNFAPRLQRASR